MPYTAQFAETGIAPAAGSSGDPFDNALVESQIVLFEPS
jgi:hypothetical protein